MAKVKKKARIVEKKLGRQRAWGQYHPESALIEIDPRTRSKPYMDTCIHELLHHADPKMSETKVWKVARIIANGLWGRNFRRIMK